MPIVKIPEPCHESWDKMIPTRKGKFCLSCKKEVVDFSNKSTDEIINYFQSRGNTKERLCGRFDIKHVEQPKQNKKYYHRYITWGIGVLVGVLQSCGWNMRRTTSEIDSTNTISEIVESQNNTSSLLGKVAPSYLNTSSKYKDTQIMGNIIKPVKTPADSIEVEQLYNRIQGEVIMGDIEELEIEVNPEDSTGLVAPIIKGKVIMGDTTIPVKSHIKKQN